MREVEKRAPPPNRCSLPARLYLVGGCILAAGWLAGTLIYFNASADAPAGDLAYGIGWEKRYAFQLQRFGGQAAVLADEFSQWFSALWHGRQLAFTVATLCTGIALLCFLVARGLSAGNRDDARRGS